MSLNRNRSKPMNEKARILVISHHERVRALVAEILRSVYDVFTAPDGTRGMQLAVRIPPDLLILDLQTPGVEEYQLRRILRSRHNYQTPLIMLFTTASSASSCAVPDPLDLHERVETVLHKKHVSLKNSPSVRFPGNLMIGQHLAHWSGAHATFAVGYTEVNHFPAYNKQYGTTKGDQFLLHTRKIVEDVVRSYGTPQDIMKHIGGNDFIFITVPETAPAICVQTISSFDATIPAYYSPQAQMEPSCSTAPRLPIPVATLSIAVITNLQHEFVDFCEMGEIAAEINTYLKTLPGSRYAIDRRH